MSEKYCISCAKINCSPHLPHGIITILNWGHALERQEAGRFSAKPLARNAEIALQDEDNRRTMEDYGKTVMKITQVFWGVEFLDSVHKGRLI